MSFLFFLKFILFSPFSVKKRLETNIRNRKSTRLNVFDLIRNLEQCKSPVAPVPDHNSKVEHRRQLLEKWKQEKEKKKKEQAALKKKPFLIGVARAPIKYVPPPPPPSKKPPKELPSTSGRVTRSQAAQTRLAQQKTIQTESLKSFAPKNALFKPPHLPNIPKLQLEAPQAKTKKSAPIKFEPVITINIKQTRSRTNLRQTEHKVVLNRVTDTKNKAKVSKPNTKTIGNLQSSSSSESQSLSPIKKTKANENILNRTPCTVSSNQITPKTNINTPEAIQEANKISPCVTMSRGKDNARREMKKKLEEGLLDEDASDLDSVDYFRKQLASEIERMTGMCETWDTILQQNMLPEAVQEVVLGAVGQARLLMSAKLAQFAALVERCARPPPGAALVTPADLHGFWDMVYMQVENVDMRFKKLEELRARGWQEEQPTVKPRVVKPVVKPKPVKPSAGTSKLKDMIAAARKAKKEQTAANPGQPEEKPAAAEEKKTFEAGFFSVQSPVRTSYTPQTPQRKNSLLKAVLSSEAKKSASKNAPFAMLRASVLCKNMECEGIAPLPLTPKPQMNPATPGRSILKQNSVKKSARKSIKVVVFDESGHDVNHFAEDTTPPARDKGLPSRDDENESDEKEDETKENSHSKRKAKLERQDALEVRSPVMTRSRRKSGKTPQQEPAPRRTRSQELAEKTASEKVLSGKRSGKIISGKGSEKVHKGRRSEKVLQDLQINSNETPRSSRRRKSAAV